jgi:hypothetical protein
LSVVNSLLAWVLLPLLHTQGYDTGDDSLSFLQNTKASPLLVSAAALAAWLVGWALFLWRVGGPRTILANLRREAHALGAPDSLATLRGVAAVGLVVGLVAWGANLYLERASPLGVPPGYAHAASLDLGQAQRGEEAIYRFTLAREASVDLYFVVRTSEPGVGPAELALAGPHGQRATFFSSTQGVGAMRATVHPRALQLGPGEYSVLCTFPRAAGSLELFVRLGPPAARS